MPRKPREHFTYANVLATLALFIALGGSSYAALTLKNNSVRSKHIKNGQVRNADLGAGAVTAAKVKTGSLLAANFGPGQLPAGPRGLKGDKGDKGLKGDKGAPGSLTTVTSGYVPITASTGAGTTASVLAVGPITYSANCKSTGGGSVELSFRIASSEAGAIAASRNGHADLTTTPQQFWFESGTTAELTSQPTHLTTPSGAGSHRSDVILGIHKLGSDCVARVDAEV